MVPTRELAKQISLVFQQIGKRTCLKTFGIFGGV
jgi:superfamily II DNA/RNA helicase